MVRDNDNGDCGALKQRLVGICRKAGRPDALVRIACQELEAWYFGDTEALAVAFADESLRGLAHRQRYRDPDSIVGASAALAKVAPSFQKVSGARVMAAHMSLTENRSASFRIFMGGVQRVVDGLRQPSTSS